MDPQRGAVLKNPIGEVLRARKRLWPWPQARGDALAQLIGSVQHPRIRYQEPWQGGRAVGSGAVEGACQHVIQRRCKRAGMRWQPPGLLHVFAWRLARLKGTFQAFGARRGRASQTPG